MHESFNSTPLADTPLDRPGLMLSWLYADQMTRTRVLNESESPS